LWEIAFRESPWPEIKFGSEFAERYKRGERPPILNTTNIFAKLIVRCWAQNASERYSFVEIYEEVEKLTASVGPRTISNKSLRYVVPDSNYKHFF
jgi:hypothetical protein